MNKFKVRHRTISNFFRLNISKNTVSSTITEKEEDEKSKTFAIFMMCELNANKAKRIVLWTENRMKCVAMNENKWNLERQQCSL